MGKDGPGWDRAVVERAADRLAQPGLGRSGREAVPLRVGREPDLGAEGLDLGRREQRGVVERVARDREAPALHRVGEHDARVGRLRVAGAVGVGEDLEIVAAEVLHQRGEVVVRHAGHGRRHLGVGAGEEPLAQLGAAEGEERLVLLVRHVVDVATQVLAARPGEGLLQQVPVLRLDDVPARVGEELHQLVDLHPGDDAVQALAVDVDDPGDVAEALQRRVGDGLPDVPLVKLRVADEGDEAGRPLRAEVGLDVAPGHGREQGGDRAEADRTGGEVGDVRVLGARRVGLQPAERPQPGQVRAVELAGQVLDGVVHGRGVRLHRHLVLAARGGRTTATS